MSHNLSGQAGYDEGSSSRRHSKASIDEGDPLSKFDLFVNQSSQVVHVKSELDHYLEENVLPHTADFDILSWWKTNGLKYPNTLEALMCGQNWLQSEIEGKSLRHLIVYIYVLHIWVLVQ